MAEIVDQKLLGDHLVERVANHVILIEADLFTDRLRWSDSNHTCLLILDRHDRGMLTVRRA